MATESECKKGIETIRKFTQETREIIEKNNITVAEYNALKKLYQKDLAYYNSVTLPEWNLKRDAELNRLSNERKTWINCSSILDDQARRSQNCKDDFGDDWGVYSGTANVAGCSWGFIKGDCKKSTGKINADLLSWEAANPKPLAPTEPKQDALLVFSPIPSTAINCCDNITTIIASEITDSNISQFAECVASIQGLPEPSTGTTVEPSTGTTGTTGPDYITVTSKTNLNGNGNGDDNTPLYAAIGITVLALGAFAFI